MPYDGNGTFIPLPSPTFPAVPGTIIHSDYFNLNLKNVHDGLSAALPRNGEAAMAGNLRMAGFKISGVQAGEVPGDLVEWKQWTDTFKDSTFQKLQVPDLPVGAAGTRVPNLNWTAAYVTSVVTPILADVALKSYRDGDTYTGIHNFTGATIRVVSKPAGTNTTEAASTAFVQADFLAKFPNYTGQVKASTTELNYLVGLLGPIQPQLSNQVAGPIHAAVTKGALDAADELGIADSNAAWGLKKVTIAGLISYLSGDLLPLSGGSLSGAVDFAPPVVVVGAATTELAALDSNYVTVTGNAVINSFGVAPEGVTRVVLFTGSPTLSHNAAGIILPTAAAISVAPGDTACFQSYGGGVWRCVWFTRYNGKALTFTDLATQYRNAYETALNGATLAPNKRYKADTTAATIAVTMPAVANCAKGDEILLLNHAFRWGVNTFTIDFPVNTGFYGGSATLQTQLVCDTNAAGGIRFVCTSHDDVQATWTLLF